MKYFTGWLGVLGAAFLALLGGCQTSQEEALNSGEELTASSSALESSPKAQPQISVQGANAVIKIKLQAILAKADIPKYQLTLQGITDPDLKVDLANQEAPQLSASTIKLFVAAEIFQQIEAEQLNFHTVAADMEAMLNQSDNEATNRLIALAGGCDVITARAGQITGRQTTRLERYLDQVDESGANVTTSQDLCSLLQQLEAGQLANAAHTRQWLTWLTNTSGQDRFVTGVPSRAHIFNKSGEDWEGQVANDAAIIELDGHKYILTMLCQGTDFNPMCESMAEVSKVVAEVVSDLPEGS